MIRRFAALLLLLALLPFAAAAESGVTLPEFRFLDQYGREWTNADLEGKTVFLNFWTTWCPYCVQEMPDIETLYRETGENGGDVLILGIDTPSIVDTADEAGIATFLEDTGITYPTLIDPEGQLFSFFAITALPTTYIVDASGTVRFSTLGAMDLDTMREMIAEGTREP